MMERFRGGFVNMDVRQVLELAIQAEAKSRDRYLELAKQAEDGETRLLLEQIAREEDSHLRRLSERLKAIKLLNA
jgi:rubrerythrin